MRTSSTNQPPKSSTTQIELQPQKEGSKLDPPTQPKSQEAPAKQLKRTSKRRQRRYPTLVRNDRHRRRKSGGVNTPTMLQPPIPVINHIPEGQGVVPDHFDKMIFQSRHHQLLSPKDNIIPLLPYQMTQGPKGEPSNGVEEIFT